MEVGSGVPGMIVRDVDCSDVGERDIMAWMTVGGDEADGGGFRIIGHGCGEPRDGEEGSLVGLLGDVIYKTC